MSRWNQDEGGVALAAGDLEGERRPVGRPPTAAEVRGREDDGRA